jgi:hypothetical protein
MAAVAGVLPGPGLRPGRRALLNYGLVVWHERIALAQVQGSEWVVCSPDFELFVEQLDRTNPDLDGFRLAPLAGGLPLGVAAGDVYGFGAVTAAELLQLIEEGGELAIQERLVRGLAPVGPLVPAAPGPGGAAAVPVAPVAPAAPPGLPAPAALGGALLLGGGAGGGGVSRLDRISGLAGSWVLDEPTADFDIGDEFTLPAGALVSGSRALALVGTDVTVFKYLVPGANISEYARLRRAFLCDDPRILPQVPAPRSFAEAVKEMIGGRRSVLPPSTLTGPETSEWFLDEVVKGSGGGMISRHHRWRAESGVGQHDRIVYEHEVLSRALELGVVIDGYNLKASVMGEFLLRRLQLQEEAVAESPANPSYEGSQHYLGVSDRKGGALVAPSLRAHVAAELGKEAAILKEKRKARESKPTKLAKGAKGGEAPAS